MINYENKLETLSALGDARIKVKYIFYSINELYNYKYRIRIVSTVALDRSWYIKIASVSAFTQCYSEKLTWNEIINVVVKKWAMLMFALTEVM